MTLALMRCCATAPILDEYERATDQVLSRCGVGVTELDFNCCGYPLRNSRFEAWVLSSARNLALAERAGADLVTVCACCFGSMKQVDHLLRTDATLRDGANAAIAGERLRCSGSAKVRHLLQVLRDDIGIEGFRARRQRTLQGLKVACHYGCHLLRPSDVVRFDDPQSPTILDELVEATGAESVPWAAQLECCGSPASGVDDELSTDLAAKKLRSAQESGADVLCVVCPYCFIQLDGARRRLGPRASLPVVLVHQLLGVSLGADAAAVGLTPDRLPRALAAAGGGGRP